MRRVNKTVTANYFEEVYLGKSKNELSLHESKRLQKLLSIKAIRNSGGVNTSDLKKMNLPKPKATFIMDFDNFLLPFDF
jgi:hypothetical protein